MARGSKSTGGGKKIAAPVKSALNKSKKVKNIFKVVDTKCKKPKEVQGKLKMMKATVSKKHEKADADLQHLHKGLVMKIAKVTVDIPKKEKKQPAEAKIVSEQLDDMKF